MSAARWVVAIVVVLAVVAVVLFARGPRDHGVPVSSPAGYGIELIV